MCRILPDGTRRIARLFSGFLSHYVIRDRYGRPGTGALLDRLTYHVHILEMNGESSRLNHSRARKKRASR